jgi:hypothetical protein
MQLYRYNPWCVKNLKLTPYHCFVKFKNSTFRSHQNFIYVSTQIFSSALLASNYLSLTYNPRHRYGFDSGAFTLTDNEGNLIDNRLNTSYTRSWPAFGKHGGGIELMLESNKNEASVSLIDNFYLDGGSFDLFHQDAILPLTLSSIKLVAEKTTRIFENTIENSIGSVKEGSMVFKWEKNKRQFTISVGITEKPEGMILHIWGVEWRDNNRFREILCNIEDELQVINKGKEELCSEFDSNSGIHFTEFSQKINKIANILLENDKCYFYMFYDIFPCLHPIFLP